MHFTLHLTDACNLACRYCYVRQAAHYMDASVAREAVKLAASTGTHCGLIFFGGEPLLCRDRIEDTIACADDLQRAGKGNFHYKITTNGLLLDEAFLRYSAAHEVFIALSHDGVKEAHDANRVTRDGGGTFEALKEKAGLLLRYRPYAPVMMTVAPGVVEHYARGVEYLYGLGFRYLICTIDYSGDWGKETLDELKRQYLLLAKWYREKTLNEEKFYFSPFEVKISSHVHRSNYCAERCELGKKQISVAPDGGLYPCVQFVGEEKYRIGDVFSGIDQEKRRRLYRINEEEREGCNRCALKNRCNHYCACLNKQSTGDFTKVSPVLCAHERILLPIADRLAGELYEKRSALFIQKQYNDMFPLLSLAEDRLYEKGGVSPF